MNEPNRIVSSEAEELILVDTDDNETGFLSKADCHDGDGVLHRAFSLFLFNDDGELLLQQRSESKRLWPGYWSNSICSHPRRGESMAVATRRRLLDELNIEAELEFIYKFNYQAGFGERGSENELCHVYLGKAPADIRPNESEISAVRFIAPAELDREFAEKPESLTPWFRMEWQVLSTDYQDRLLDYASLE
ncbi:MAG: isopentenyl-diphosphate Delta-isomerase [Woeseiaceae bacterium]|nr:isopentenyl-diphosphate Delta-isomerase [Woeseiaceae bacterium]